MRLRNILIAALLILAGIGFYAYYDQKVKPERQAREMFAEAELIFERGDRESVNRAVDIFTKIIARYPETRYAVDSYVSIAKSYEKIGLYRQAYLKYSYLLKDRRVYLSGDQKKDIMARMAHIKILQNNTDEGVHALYNVVSKSEDREFRSRVYAELGHTYLKTGDISKAGSSFDIAMREFGSNEEAVLGKARVLVRQGHYDDAFKLYDYFLANFGAVSTYTKDVNDAYLTQAYNAGLSAYRSGRYYPAIGYFGKVLKNYGGSGYAENALYWTGESYYALKRYNDAINYFGRTLNNGSYSKDEDARLKRGYSYFMLKKYDLAAREFELYLHHYPRGRYASVARRWKSMSTQELLYRIQNESMPKVDDVESGRGLQDNGTLDRAPAPSGRQTAGDEEVSGRADRRYPVELENVTEL